MNFDQLYQQYYVQIHRFCYRFVDDEEIAGDLTQDTFMKLYLRMKDNKEPIENPRAWLYRVAGNNCLNATSQHNRRAELMDAYVHEGSETKDPESILLEKEQKELVKLSLEQLRPEHRVLVLMYGDGLSYAEMAEATNIPMNSIGKTLWRSIEKIANTIKKTENGPGRTIY